MHDSNAGPLHVSAEIGGLGNRIKSWVSVMRSGEDWRVHWPVNKYMPASFSQLFQNECAIAEIPEDALIYKSWRLQMLPQDLEHLPAGFATVGAGTTLWARENIAAFVDYNGEFGNDTTNHTLAGGVRITF
jgi:hypothetical protein